MDEGHVVVDSITPIPLKKITNVLARESGFDSVDDLPAHCKARPRRQGVLDPLPLLAARRVELTYRVFCTGSAKYH